MDKVYLVRWEERDWEGDSGIVDICATEEIALATKKNWEKECPNDDVWIEPWEIETEMPKILKDISKVHILTRFKLNRSDAEYTVMYGPDDEKFIVNLEEGYIYTIEEIRSGECGFTFYKKDDDPSFLGVEVFEENE